jgi:hypothetical protein
MHVPALNSDWKEGGPEAIGYLNQLTDHIFTKAKKAIIRFWASKQSGGTLTWKSDALKKQKPDPEICKPILPPHWCRN